MFHSSTVSRTIHSLIGSYVRFSRLCSTSPTVINRRINIPELCPLQWWYFRLCVYHFSSSDSDLNLESCFSTTILSMANGGYRPCSFFRCQPLDSRSRLDEHIFGGPLVPTSERLRDESITTFYVQMTALCSSFDAFAATFPLSEIS